MATGAYMLPQRGMPTMPLKPGNFSHSPPGTDLGSTVGGQTSPRSSSHTFSKPQVQLKNSSMSDMNTSVGGISVSRQQLGFERRVAWLEEDVSVLQRRLRDECGEGGTGCASGDQGLRALVARLDGELAAERRARGSLEARLAGLEAALMAERKEREAQLQAFSGELESTMRGIIDRIDEGLSVGAARVRERTDQTEVRLRTLISRVDEGLSVGAAALQDTLTTVSATVDPIHGAAKRGGSRPRSPGRARSPGQRAPSPTRQAREGEQASVAAAQTQPQTEAAATAMSAQNLDTSVPSENLLISYDQLRQENMWLRERRAQLQGVSATPGQGITPAATPSLAYPGTLQVPGSGIAQFPMSTPSSRRSPGGGATSPLTMSAVGRAPSASVPLTRGGSGNWAPMSPYR